MGLTRGWWNMGPNPGYCYQAEHRSGQRDPLEAWKNSMRSRISPSQDRGADMDTVLVPLTKGTSRSRRGQKAFALAQMLLVPFVL